MVTKHLRSPKDDLLWLSLLTTDTDPVYFAEKKSRHTPVFLKRNARRHALLCQSLAVVRPSVSRNRHTERAAHGVDLRWNTCSDARPFSRGCGRLPNQRRTEKFTGSHRIESSPFPATRHRLYVRAAKRRRKIVGEDAGTENDLQNGVLVFGKCFG